MVCPMEAGKQVYLKCKSSKELFTNSSIVEFDSVYFGYPYGGCAVNNEDIKQSSDNSLLVRLIGDVSENKGTSTSMNKEYVFVKINSLFDKGWAHFLVPKENIVYLNN